MTCENCKHHEAAHKMMMGEDHIMVIVTGEVHFFATVADVIDFFEKGEGRITTSTTKQEH